MQPVGYQTPMQELIPVQAYPVQAHPGSEQNDCVIIVLEFTDG